jgi:hypothetical protein
MAVNRVVVKVSCTAGKAGPTAPAITLGSLVPEHRNRQIPAPWDRQTRGQAQRLAFVLITIAPVAAETVATDLSQALSRRDPGRLM